MSRVFTRFAELAAQRMAPTVPRIYTGQVYYSRGGGAYDIRVHELGATLANVQRITSDTRALTRGRSVTLLRIGAQLIVL